MYNKSLIASGVAVLLIVLGVVVLSRNNSQNINGPASNTKTTQNTDTQSAPENVPEQSERQVPKNNDNTITYTDAGFSQNILTVKAGSIVSVRNNSSRILQFDSDPHPQHTDNPELNIGNISPGHQRSITVTKTGTHGFHNHANDNHTGTLVVE